MSVCPKKYFPFLSGVYSTAPGLTPTHSGPTDEDRRIFQIDHSYHHYLHNKQQCRIEDIRKYYLTERLQNTTIQTINRHIADRLTQEYPAQFKLKNNGRQFINLATGESIDFDSDLINLADTSLHYLSLFDALCSQVQEDVAVIQLTSESDYLAAIHLCSPNHWSPAEKIGRPFDTIHRPVPLMESSIANYRKILNSIVVKQYPFTRYAWGIGTDDRLNHHPITPVDQDPEQWQGRFQPGKDIPLFLRVERQILIGFPQINAVMFTIRTYFYNIDTLSINEKQKLLEAIQSMPMESLLYKGLNTWVDELKNRLLKHSDSIN